MENRAYFNGLGLAGILSQIPPDDGANVLIRTSRALESLGAEGKDGVERLLSVLDNLVVSTDPSTMERQREINRPVVTAVYEALDAIAGPSTQEWVLQRIRSARTRTQPNKVPLFDGAIGYILSTPNGARLSSARSMVGAVLLTISLSAPGTALAQSADDFARRALEASDRAAVEGRQRDRYPGTHTSGIDNSVALIEAIMDREGASAAAGRLQDVLDRRLLNEPDLSKVIGSIGALMGLHSKYPVLEIEAGISDALIVRFENDLDDAESRLRFIRGLRAVPSFWESERASRVVSAIARHELDARHGELNRGLLAECVLAWNATQDGPPPWFNTGLGGISVADRRETSLVPTGRWSLWSNGANFVRGQERLRLRGSLRQDGEWAEQIERELEGANSRQAVFREDFQNGRFGELLFYGSGEGHREIAWEVMAHQIEGLFEKWTAEQRSDFYGVLLTTARIEDDPDILKNMAWTLSQLELPEKGEAIIEQMMEKSPDPQTRAFLALAIGNSNFPDGPSMLLKLLGITDEHPDIDWDYFYDDHGALKPERQPVLAAVLEAILALPESTAFISPLVEILEREASGFSQPQRWDAEDRGWLWEKALAVLLDKAEHGSDSFRDELRRSAKENLWTDSSFMAKNVYAPVLSRTSPETVWDYAFKNESYLRRQYPGPWTVGFIGLALFVVMRNSKLRRLPGRMASGAQRLTRQIFGARLAASANIGIRSTLFALVAVIAFGAFSMQASAATIAGVDREKHQITIELEDLEDVSIRLRDYTPNLTRLIRQAEGDTDLRLETIMPQVPRMIAEQNAANPVNPITHMDRVYADQTYVLQTSSAESTDRLAELIRQNHDAALLARSTANTAVGSGSIAPRAPQASELLVEPDPPSSAAPDPSATALAPSAIPLPSGVEAHYVTSGDDNFVDARWESAPDARVRYYNVLIDPNYNALADPVDPEHDDVRQYETTEIYYSIALDSFEAARTKPASYTVRVQSCYAINYCSGWSPGTVVTVPALAVAAGQAQSGAENESGGTAAPLSLAVGQWLEGVDKNKGLKKMALMLLATTLGLGIIGILWGWMRRPRPADFKASGGAWSPADRTDANGLFSSPGGATAHDHLETLEDLLGDGRRGARLALINSVDGSPGLDARAESPFAMTAVEFLEPARTAAVDANGARLAVVDFPESHALRGYKVRAEYAGRHPYPDTDLWMVSLENEEGFRVRETDDYRKIQSQNEMTPGQIAQAVVGGLGVLPPDDDGFHAFVASVVFGLDTSARNGGAPLKEAVVHEGLSPRLSVGVVLAPGQDWEPVGGRLSELLAGNAERVRFFHTNIDKKSPEFVGIIESWRKKEGIRLILELPLDDESSLDNESFEDIHRALLELLGGLDRDIFNEVAPLLKRSAGTDADDLQPLNMEEKRLLRKLLSTLPPVQKRNVLSALSETSAVKLSRILTRVASGNSEHALRFALTEEPLFHAAPTEFASVHEGADTILVRQRAFLKDANGEAWKEGMAQLDEIAHGQFNNAFWATDGDLEAMAKSDRGAAIEELVKRYPETAVFKNRVVFASEASTTSELKQNMLQQGLLEGNLVVVTDEPGQIIQDLTDEKTFVVSLAKDTANTNGLLYASAKVAQNPAIKIKGLSVLDEKRGVFYYLPEIAPLYQRLIDALSRVKELARAA